ncbi:hypothetical protein FJTKL_01519 [Diaporthe vaccinii]|uniref:Uncharacterized protein n=1 Tax=Diaporthe vaccinii TaxID=105482 RepID=A0ABR4E099_9PEZI
MTADESLWYTVDRHVVQRVYCFKLWHLNNLQVGRNEHLHHLSSMSFMSTPHILDAIFNRMACRVRKNDTQVDVLLR